MLENNTSIKALILCSADFAFTRQKKAESWQEVDELNKAAALASIVRSDPETDGTHWIWWLLSYYDRCRSF